VTRLPLTMAGYLVGRDAAQEGDPRPLDDWAARCLAGGGWEHVEALDDLVPISNRDVRIMLAASKALAERRDGMPHTLERALIEGWARLTRGGGSLRMSVFLSGPSLQRQAWRYHGWSRRGAPAWCHWSTPSPYPPVPWSDLSPAERNALLREWPSVVAWHDSPETAQAPWEAVGA